MHSDSFKLRDWDSGLPDTFAMQRFRSNLLDTAIVMNGAETANGLGLAHEVLSGADHHAILGQASAPIPEPEDYAGPEARMRNQGRLFHKYGILQRLIPILRSLVISGLPERILRLAEINGSTRHHTHTFEEREGGTLCRDRVRYWPRGGALMNWLFVRKDVERIFEYRRQRLMEIFP